MWDILKTVAKTSVYFNEIIWLVIMKMRMKMKNRSHRYDITGVSQDMVTNLLNSVSQYDGYCSKQHLSNIWSWIHEKVKQNWCLVKIRIPYKKNRVTVNGSLRGKCPNTEFFLVRIFLDSDWIKIFTEWISVFSPNTGKYGPKKLCIWTLFTQWLFMNIIFNYDSTFEFPYLQQQ